MTNEEKEEETPEWKNEILNFLGELETGFLEDAEEWDNEKNDGTLVTEQPEKRYRSDAKEDPLFEGLICKKCDAVADNGHPDDEVCVHCEGELEWWKWEACHWDCGNAEFVNQSDWNCTKCDNGET